MDKENFELTSEIVSGIIRNQNIEVRIRTNSKFYEVGIVDKHTGDCIFIDELVDYLAKDLR